MPRMIERKYDKNEVFPRILAWCDRQERSIKQVNEKLYSWGIEEVELESTISELKKKGALDELRFCHAYSRDSMKFKKWGRAKIKVGLIKAGISTSVANQVLNELEEEEYMSVLSQLAHAAVRKGHHTKTYQDKMKFAAHLARKGFEASLIFNMLDELDQG